MVEAKAPRRAMKTPKRARLSGFVHLLARFYQNYLAACVRAAHRKKARAVDIDVQHSVEGTPWAFHWPTVGKNKLHDPHKKIGKNRRIDSLTDEQIEGLRGPKGQKPQKLITLLHFCANNNVRVEAEVKTYLSYKKVREIMDDPIVARMSARGLLYWKTLAFMGYKSNHNAAAGRLRPVHDAKGRTILSFTGFGKRRGLSKKVYWPVTDFVRGRAKWVA